MKAKEIKDYINNEMDSIDVINLWNDCIEDKNILDDKIYNNGEDFFEEMFSSPYDAVRAVAYGEYTLNDNYIAFDGYGNIVTFDYWDDEGSPVDIDILADWLLDNEVVAMEYGIE